MKKNITYLAQAAMAMLLLCFSTHVSAQGTSGSNLVLQVTIDGVSSYYNEGDCGYGTANWGGSLTQAAFCGSIAWGYDITPDSLGCDSIPAGQLAGKIGMIRRGVCEFGLKALNAEKAGAIAVIIANGTAATHGNDCAAPGLGAGAVGAQVTVPVISVCRNVATQIDNALKAGQDVQICFLLPNVASPYVSAAYATPKSQVDSIDLMSFVFYNRGTDTINDLVIKADITGPNGYSNTITTAISGVPPAYDGLVFFDPYLPPSVVGKYNVVMSNNKFTEVRDTLRRSFEITDYTYAVDNLKLINAGLWNNTSFQAGGLLYQTGALYFTGPDGGTATYSTFGISNKDSIYTGDPANDVIQILVYDADSDEDGVLNFQGGAFADLANDVVGLATYTMDGTESWDKLVNVAIEDFNIGGIPVPLKPNHAYYISLVYDGINNGSGRCPGFNASSSEDYLVYDGNALTTPLVMDATYSGWSGGTIVNRMQLEGFDPNIVAVKDPNRLDAGKYSITPNPGNDYVNLNLELSSVNKQVIVTIFTPNGQVIRSQNLKDFQSGQLRFDVKDVPTGTYLMWIRTHEGIAVQKVSVCH